MPAHIETRVDVEDVRSHHYAVTLQVPRPGDEVVVSLPVWIPGSYLVREFGRHLSGFEATQAGHDCPVEALDKTTWRIRAGGRGPLVLRYRVYAFDTSVRTAWLDAQRGFFNGTSLCLRVAGREHEPHGLRIGRLPRGWRVATAMAPVSVDADGRGLYRAADYDELVDHPFELGTFWRGEFEAGGVPHELVVSGAWPGFDGARLLEDTRRICEAELRFWHGAAAGRRASPPPFGRYVFLLNTTEDGYGGLEHRASTALLASRRDLPRVRGGVPDGYTQLLGLISHEYFHTWNVKRLKPSELARLDYTRENYTELLWFFEGFTSYYDDLFLRRAGLIDTARYLKLLNRTVQGVLATPGRFVQSVAEASFDAWVKYYRPDENTGNATVSYYTQGALVGLCLDAGLRDAGSSLDDVMRALWRDTGGGPITEADILRAVRAAGGPALAQSLQHWVHHRGDLPLAQAFSSLGIAMREERQPLAQALGLKLSEGPVSGVQVKSVATGSAAQRAGLQAGDELLAADGWRLRRLDDLLAWADLDHGLTLLISRDQRVHTLHVDTDGIAGATQWTLALHEGASAERRALRDAWLSEPPAVRRRAAAAGEARRP